jgi:pyruvate-ferredoxin/flavodoxin oxidoreductase
MAAAWAALRVHDVALERRARLLLESPSDLEAKLEELQGLSWESLEIGEREATPPVILLTDVWQLAAGGFSDFSHALSTGLPLKVVVFDEHDVDRKMADPLLLSLAHRDAFVASTSIAHAEHLYQGVAGAIGHAGAAMIHVHTPSPLHHGFATSETIQRARRAVAAKVHSLAIYDPAREGVFGTRLSLETAGLATEGTASPGAWLAEERRFAQLSEPERARFEEERSAVHRTLLELSGMEAPMSNKVRKELEQSLGAKHEAEVAELLKEHQQALMNQEQRMRLSQAQQLRDRLLQLAGYGDGPVAKTPGEDKARP